MKRMCAPSLARISSRRSFLICCRIPRPLRKRLSSLRYDPNGACMLTAPRACAVHCAKRGAGGACNEANALLGHVATLLRRVWTILQRVASGRKVSFFVAMVDYCSRGRAAARY